MRSNIDEILSINPSANVFVFGDFNIHNKDWVTYSGEELIHLVNSVIIFFISDDLTQTVNFPTRIPGCDSNNIFVSCYLPLIWKNFVTHASSCSFCDRRASFCTGLIYRKMCIFLFMFSTGFNSFSLLLVCTLFITFFVLMHGFWCFS